MVPVSSFCLQEEMTALERKTRIGNRDSAFNYVPNPEELDLVNDSMHNLIDVDGVTSVQAAFLRVFVSLFGDQPRLVALRKGAAAAGPIDYFE